MILRLILMRHAKSDWDNPLDTDHQRPLNPRGRRAAPLMGQWLAAQGYLPDQALVSDATRTRQTWEAVAAELPAAVPATFLPALYLAGPAKMRRVLAQTNAATVLMIGHNPGIAEFAAHLLDSPPQNPDFARYPTGATLIAEFDSADWGQIGTGRLVAFNTPRTLDGG